MNIVFVGDEIVLVSSLYGGIYNFFLFMFFKLGIIVKFVNVDNSENFRNVIIFKIKVIYVEFVGNL